MWGFVRLIKMPPSASLGVQLHRLRSGCSCIDFARGAVASASLGVCCIGFARGTVALASLGVAVTSASLGVQLRRLRSGCSCIGFARGAVASASLGVQLYICKDLYSEAVSALRAQSRRAL
jgi:hypothetical protein